ncbi:sensor histidine kinase [Actinobacteria bacterium YIM 96077]|uniref:Oxygen sensor histidine kinase NreB n=1 Tax=Phytoactinopolyspora halophila TaxID=1981511 RepID=A0A329QLA1_9ACTN|nr:sensor histidine kinase [Phytoactinopolyspora halophila]AYY14850.1 sensor histidine kinase [Actinobacteria bacterium YIM 96077]RAW13124.1 sensor histidine kinase [Phytoactinopolyspora halophila]
MAGRRGRLQCGDTTTNWEWWWEALLIFVPWILLIPPTVVSQMSSDQSWTNRAGTLALVVLAASWVLAGHTLASRERRARAAPMAVYFVGLLALFVALMSRDEIFVLFAITGFFHAYQLRPWPVGVAGVFGTSVVLNTMAMGFPEAKAQSIGTYVGVIAIQTAAIGVGIVFAVKGAEHDRQREEMVARLEAALEENAGLHAQLLTQAREAGVLDERQRMAREIHDTLAQGLTGIVTQVQAAQRGWEPPDQARQHLDRALELARHSLTEARRSVQALRPRELDGAHLPDALDDLAQQWAEGTGVTLSVGVTGDRLPLSPAIEVALFRAAQEALTNVAKHAQASRVGLTLSYLDDVVLLDVRDDGKGMQDRGQAGFGLNSMRQRIRSVGGTVDIESEPGEGTAISASVPAITVEQK